MTVLQSSGGRFSAGDDNPNSVLRDRSALVFVTLPCFVAASSQPWKSASLDIAQRHRYCHLQVFYKELVCQHR